MSEVQGIVVNKARVYNGTGIRVEYYVNGKHLQTILPVAGYVDEEVEIPALTTKTTVLHSIKARRTSGTITTSGL